MAAVSSVIVGVGLGFGLLNMFKGTPSPNIPPAPAPASYFAYGEDGRVTEQVWDAGKNAYITRTGWTDPEKEAEYKAEQAMRTEMRKAMLANVKATPEDRVKAGEEFAKTYAAAMHKDVDKRFGEYEKHRLEQLEKQGLTGSRAYADTMKALGEQKTAVDTDIAQRALLAKEQLAETDRQYWMSVLAHLDAGASKEALEGIQRQQLASQGAAQATASVMGGYNAQTLARMQEWEARMRNDASNTNNLVNTASGLSYLYGYKGAGGGDGKKKEFTFGGG